MNLKNSESDANKIFDEFLNQTHDCEPILAPTLKEWIEKGKGKAHEQCLNFSMNTGNDNDYWNHAYDDLIKLGCTSVRVSNIGNDSLEEYGTENIDYADTLWIVLPEKIPPSLIACICMLRPDDVSEESENVIKLWWD